MTVVAIITWALFALTGFAEIILTFSAATLRARRSPRAQAVTVRERLLRKVVLGLFVLAVLASGATSGVAMLSN